MRKRHHSQFNFNAPFINALNNIKRWWQEKDYYKKKEIVKMCNKIVAIISIIITLLLLTNKVIAYQYDQYNAERAEWARLEKEAQLKEERIKLLQQYEYQKELEEKARTEKQLSEAKTYNNFVRQNIIKQYPIGTYIKVNDNYIGKIKRIDGDEIWTTDGWQCNYTYDKINKSEWKEYKEFIKDNSKG